MAVFNVKDFGAIGDGIHDDFQAFRRALDTLDSLIPPNELLLGGGGVLFIPAGIYKLTQTLVVKTGTIIQGSGAGTSALRFDDPSNIPDSTIAGIVLQTVMEPPPALSARFSRIRDLTISTNKSYNPSGASPLTPHPPEISESAETAADGGILHSGISIIGASECSVEHCFVNGFEHDGICIITGDHWEVRACDLQSNGRHGLFVAGVTSGGCAMRVRSGTNRKFGFYDIAQAGGNAYLACLAEANGRRVPGEPAAFGGGYHMERGGHTLLGCTEDEGAYDEVISPAAALGGILGTGAADGSVGVVQYPLHVDGIVFPPVLYMNRDFSAPGVRSSGVKPINNSQLDANQAFPIPDGTHTMIPADASSVPQGTNMNIILPDTTIQDNADNLRGYQLTVKKVDRSRNPVVLRPRAGQTIDGQSEVALTDQYSWVTVLWGIDTWHIIGRSPPPPPPPG